MNDISWKIIDTLFRDNPDLLVKHHLESYNDFFENGIKNIFKSSNPLRFFKELEKIGDKNVYKYECNMYFGGKEGDKIYYGKPMIYDNDGTTNRQHYMYPNEARLRNMTYAMTIHYDLVVNYTLLIENDSGKLGMEGYDKKEVSVTYEKIFLGKFPIMLQSDLCILKGLSTEARFNMGECRNDLGGYFIIDGKEKVIISQEGRADNILYIKDDVNDQYSHSAEIRSVSEDASKPIRTLKVLIVRDSSEYTNNQIVVNVPNVRKPIPLFILMRALGVISDKEIIKTCLLDLEKNDMYIDYFRPSVHDAGNVFTQQSALRYISTFTKGKTISNVMEILMIYFLPHVGELNFRCKALYLGYMVKKLLLVYSGNEQPTNRDSYAYKRIEISGMLIYQLFREYFILEQKNIYLKMDKEYYYKGNDKNYQNMDFLNLLENNKNRFFADRKVEEGFRKGFKGNWGAEAHTKRIGLVQDLNRLSFFWFMTLLRKTNLPIAADGAKIVAPRLLNATQYGYLCPIHSPDGGNIGLHKHLSTSTHITSGCSGIPYIKYLRTMGIKIIEECSVEYLANTSKIFINGNWIGATNEPLKIVKNMKLHRRNNIIDIFTSIYFNYKNKEIIIWTDAGRPTRPLFYMKGNQLSFENDNVFKKITDNKLNWRECLYGFQNTNVDREPCDLNYNKITEKVYEKLVENSSVVEYIDTQEGHGMVLAKSIWKRDQYKSYRVTHCEIHPSMTLGVMANQIIFPSHNPYPRNAFSCGQGKQAVSLFNTNFNNRIDKTAYLLNYGQTPLTKSRMYSYTTKDANPYGENAIVAIMCYSGYNVEDAVIVNEGAIERGLFNTTYFNAYEAHEEKVNVGNAKEDTIFLNPLKKNMLGLKSGYDYSKLDEKYGIIRENVEVDEKTILIGMGTKQLGTEEEIYLDVSVTPKKGQVGFVDKVFITQNEEGRRIAKVRIRAERKPAIGDKFCSRAGQKGTIGIKLREQDMPTTADGIRPDIIVNPHAMPSRMTIGHLVETLTSKAACIMGSFSNCTAYESNGPKHEMLGNILLDAGYHSSGCDYLYNGMTGEQMESQIYIGPTYYLRLKHMPKDKINYRARGPRTLLTRQTVQGRANNGGLRIGEMDRDCLIAHGMTQFIKESMLVRGDEYYMAVCNNTGCVAIYNESKNLFLSPMCDGPIKFVGNLENNLNIKNISKFGKDFSVIRVPYCFKLLLQELKTMNVQMRIITDKNIDAIQSMKKSDNSIKLTGKELGVNMNNTLWQVKNNTYKKPEILKGEPREEVKEIPIVNKSWVERINDDSDWGAPDFNNNMIEFNEGISLKSGELPASALSKEQIERINKSAYGDNIILMLWEPLYMKHFISWFKNANKKWTNRFPNIDSYGEDVKNTFEQDVNIRYDSEKIRDDKGNDITNIKMKEYVEHMYRITQLFIPKKIWEEGVTPRDPAPRGEHGEAIGWRNESVYDKYGMPPESPWNLSSNLQSVEDEEIYDDPLGDNLEIDEYGNPYDRREIDKEEPNIDGSESSKIEEEIDEDTGKGKITIGDKVYLEVEEPPEIEITRKTVKDNEDGLEFLNIKELDEEEDENKNKEEEKKVIIK